MKYFAYGTNMSRRQMNDRCPSNKILSKAKLKGYKFIFNSRGVATIILADKVEVHGVIYEIDKECLENLKRYEGYPNFYEIEDVEVVDENNNRIETIVFIATDLNEGCPREDHLNIILTGAQENNLPLEYIKYLRNKKK